MMYIPKVSARTLTLPVAFSIVAFFLSSASAIVVADNPALHVVSGICPYNMVGYYGGASAVLIDSTHALTAAHVASSAGLGTMYLDLAGGRQGFSVSEVSICPTADLAVITLSQSTGLSGFPLYTGTDEIGKTAILLGYGISGVGSSDSLTYPRGTLRIGYNVIGNASSKYLYMTFDAPNNKASLGASMEALAAAGDSGGATLIAVEGELYLAGIHSSITNFSGWPNPPYYGDMGIDVRVSSFASWINNEIAVVEIALPGDYNGDGFVDMEDYTVWADNFGWTGSPGENSADGNNDGVVNLADYSVWADQFGQNTPPGHGS